MIDDDVTVQEYSGLWPAIAPVTAESYVQLMHLGLFIPQCGQRATVPGSVCFAVGIQLCIFAYPTLCIKKPWLPGLPGFLDSDV